MFTKPVSDVSRRAVELMGCDTANSYFGTAARDLYVALPVREMTKAPQNILIEPVTSLADFTKIFILRSLVYMAEQGASFAEEFDANDFCATHLIAYVDGEPAGCVRIRYFGDFAKLERFAVAPTHRRSRLMFKLARAAIDHCRQKGFRKLYAHAREDLVPVWGRFGARAITGRRPFSFSDIGFIELEMEIEPGNQHLSVVTDPAILNRPEGFWHLPGPLDVNQLVKRPQRAESNRTDLRRFAQ